MTLSGDELRSAISLSFKIEKVAETKRMINKAIRTLPGGSECLDAIESTNAARNHAAKARDQSRVVAIDAAIDNLESIRTAMSNHVLLIANEASRRRP